MFRLWKKRPPAATITPPTPPSPPSLTLPPSPHPPYIHGGVRPAPARPGQVFGLQLKFIWYFIRGHWQLFVIIGILITLVITRLPKDLPWLLGHLHPSPSPAPTIEAPVEIIPTPRTPDPLSSDPLLPTASPVIEQPTPTPSLPSFSAFPYPSPTSAPPTPAPAPYVPFSISWLEVPNQTTSGQPFTVRWLVDGTVGSRGQLSELKAQYIAPTSGGGTIQQNQHRFFSSFTTPKQFSASLTFDGPPGTITLEATATVEGQSLTTTATIPTN